MDLKNARLPRIFKRNGKDCYDDPIRRRLIYVTPEEVIRQKVVSYLIDTLEVPANMIDVEAPLSHFILKNRKRADIVIWGNCKQEGYIHPLAVIECKADNIPTDEKAMEQAFGYSDDLGSDYTVLTNGIVTVCFKYDKTKKKYIPIEQLPKYEDMLKGECVPVKPDPPKKRIQYERLEEELRKRTLSYEDNPWYYIHKNTSQELALPCFNLLEGLLDESVKMPSGDYGLFELLEDYGVRNLSYGNASGGRYYNYYRSFLVNVDGNTEIYSLSFNTYRDLDDERGPNSTNTILCVAHDDEKINHHSLQLSIDKFAVADGKTVKFYHDGTIAVGNLGRGKGSELKELVEKRYPKIVMGDKYYLGSITADHLLRLDEPDVIDLIVNLISYSIVRDEYREIVKNKDKKAKKKTEAKKPAAKNAPAAPKPAPAKKAVTKKLGKIIIEIDGEQIDIKEIEKKAGKLSGDVYVVASEKKIYDKDGYFVDVF